MKGDMYLWLFILVWCSFWFLKGLVTKRTLGRFVSVVDMKLDKNKFKYFMSIYFLGIIAGVARLIIG